MSYSAELSLWVKLYATDPFLRPDTSPIIPLYGIIMVLYYYLYMILFCAFIAIYILILHFCTVAV